MDLAMLIFTAVAFGAAARLVVLGNKDPSLWTGFYRPIRLLAMILPAFRGPAREAFEFGYESSRAVPAYDVIEQLSRMLHRQGIAHDYAGGLRVDDNGTIWWIEPDFGASRLTGWVESENPDHRRQVIDGLRAFLTRDLNLRLV